MSFRSNEVADVLERKGFEQTNDKHHLRYVYILDGLKTGIHTYVSFGRKEITPLIFSQMAKQLKLSLEDTERLFSCPLSKEELYKIYNFMINEK